MWLFRETLTSVPSYLKTVFEAELAGREDLSLEVIRESISEGGIVQNIGSEVGQ